MHTTTTQRNIVPEYPNTITYQRRNWEVLGFYYDAAYQPIEVQLRSLDHRRELRIISHKQVMERYFLESNKSGMSGILNVPATINDAAYQRQNPHTYNTFKDIDIE